MLIGKVEFGEEIRTRTKVMLFQTFGGHLGGNVGEKFLRTISLEGSIEQN
jgi:hypothetical protein